MTSSQKRSALEMTNSSPTTTALLPQDTSETNNNNENQNHRPALSNRQRGNFTTLLSRSSPFANETGSLPIGEFDPSSSTTANIAGGAGGAQQQSSTVSNAKILVVGAGGLGCEILKNLAMSSTTTTVTNITVIDLDTIDVTNLNRQFLFRSKDVGKSKAEVAAKFIKERCPWVNVDHYCGKIQDKDADFYRQVSLCSVIYIHVAYIMSCEISLV